MHLWCTALYTFVGWPTELKGHTSFLCVVYSHTCRPRACPKEQLLPSRQPLTLLSTIQAYRSRLAETLMLLCVCMYMCVWCVCVLVRVYLGEYVCARVHITVSRRVRALAFACSLVRACMSVCASKFRCIGQRGSVVVVVCVSVSVCASLCKCSLCSTLIHWDPIGLLLIYLSSLEPLSWGVTDASCCFIA